jgi:hypothetical protein
MFLHILLPVKKQCLIKKWLILIIGGIFLHSCVVVMAYGLYRTIRDINDILSLVNNSIVKICMVLEEGKELKRAAEDGKLVGTLADKIPSLIQNEVIDATKEKIKMLSANLKIFSLDFTKNAIAEDLAGAKKAYNDMVGTYNEFTGLMTDLSETIPHTDK